MTFIVATARELWGLFVDDGALAIGLLAWCVFADLAAWGLSLPAPLAGPLFALGCVAMLIGSVVRAARPKLQ